MDCSVGLLAMTAGQKNTLGVIAQGISDVS
jgi:hypothetical protein